METMTATWDGGNLEKLCYLLPANIAKDNKKMSHSCQAFYQPNLMENDYCTNL
jgi:hypothetical protein